MIINGIERKFFMGVGAAMKIAEHCPGGDIAKMGEVFDGRVSRELFDILATSAVAMNEDYIAAKGLKAEPLKRSEVLLIPPGVFLGEFRDEVVAAYLNGMQTTIEAEPAPSKDPKNAEGADAANS